MNYLTLLLHAGDLAKAAKTIESIIQGCVNDKRLPNAADDKALIGAAEALLGTGLISIPGLDTAAVASALEAIKAQL